MMASGFIGEAFKGGSRIQFSRADSNTKCQILSNHVGYYIEYIVGCDMIRYDIQIFSM